MRDIAMSMSYGRKKNQILPKNTNNREPQRNTVAMQQTNAGSNRAHQKVTLHLTIYSDAEKNWLVKVNTEKGKNSKGFMKRLKEPWDRQYPERHMYQSKTQ